MPLPTVTVELTHLQDCLYDSRILTPDRREICRSRFELKEDDAVLLEAWHYLKNDAGRSELEVDNRLRGMGWHFYGLITNNGRLKNYIKHNLPNGFRLLFSLDYQTQRKKVDLEGGDEKLREEILEALRQRLEDFPEGVEVPQEATDLLWKVPWEYLHDGDNFLALRGNVEIVREAKGLGQAEIKNPPACLRILVAVAGPSGVAELDSEQELAIIQQAVDEPRLSGQLELDILEYASPDSLRERIRHFQPHIFHYTGHGGKLPYLNETYLCLETEEGALYRMFGLELKSILAASNNLHLVVLSGCMTAQTHNSDALRGVGTGLLTSVPALVAMQYSILDKSGIRFAERFYSELARGESVSGALQEARLSLKNLRSEQRADWGLPTLYQQADELVLLDKNAPPADRPLEMLQVGGLPPVKGFVGRKKELRKLRQAVTDRQTPVSYIWGLGGIGKTALVAKLVEKLKQQHSVEGIKIIRCDKIDPTLATVLDNLAGFIRLQGKAGHAEAAQYLMDSRLELRDRVAMAHRYLAHEKYLFIFDNFESFFIRQEPVGELEDKKLEEFFSCLFEYDWQSSFLFTCRYQWRLLTANRNMLDLHLEGLSKSQSFQRMKHLSRLGKLNYKQQGQALELIHGHPKYMELLNAYLNRYSLEKVLGDPGLKEKMVEEVGVYFMDGLWGDLSVEEQKALSRISVFRLPIKEEDLPRLLPQANLLDKLKGYSLVQTGEDGLWVHPVVRDYALSQYRESQRREFHQQAIEFYVGGFGELAQQARSKGHDPIRYLAKMAEYLAKQGQVKQARSLTAILLECHHHLLVSREYERAGDIVNAIHGFLAMQGERELAKELLHKSIQTLESGNKYVAKGNLATLLVEEGKGEEALLVYDECLAYFREKQAKSQMASVISQKALIYQNQGNYSQALELENEALELFKKVGNKEYIVISHYRISQLFHRMGKYLEAQKEGEQGLKMARKLKNQQFESAFLHHLGMTFNELNQPEQAFKCFQESLEIERKLGNKAGQGDSLSEIGDLLRRASQYKGALECFQEALSIAQELNDPVKVAIGLEAIGLIFEDQGHYPQALERYRQALELFKQYTPHDVDRTLNNIARVKQAMS